MSNGFFKGISLIFVASLISSFNLRSSTVYSDIGEKDIFATEKLCEGSINNVHILSKNYSEIAINSNLMYEMFSFPQNGPDTSSQTKYVLYYRIDFFINNNVHYRGAALDLLEYHNPAFLKSFTVDSTIYGIDSNVNAYSCGVDGTGESLLYSLFVTPTNGSDYTANNKTYNGMGWAENSYQYPIEKDGMPANFERLDAFTSSSVAEGSSDGEATILYNREIDYPNEFVAGPNSTESNAYYFSVYDSIIFYSEKRPTKVDIKLMVNGMYGQNTWRAYFYGSSVKGDSTSISA